MDKGDLGRLTVQHKLDTLKCGVSKWTLITPQDSLTSLNFLHSKWFV